MKKRIYYNHTDAGGIVYHTNYLVFCEQARSEIFFKHRIFFENEGYVVNEIKAKFLKPAKLGDIIEIKTKITQIKKVSLEVHQEIFKNETKLFEADISLAYIKNGKLSKIPQNHLKILNEYLQ
ncbi:YbgC/FadM family acyl-CoA thioesterase [Caminibacter sp.]